MSLNRAGGIKIALADFNKDGKTDFVIGNMGTNTQFARSPKQPGELYFADYDNNGSVDPLFCYYIQGKSYPYVTRDELLEQLGQFRKRFTNYDTYSNIAMADLFTPEQLNKFKVLKATRLETTLYLSQPNGSYKPGVLPEQVQYSPVCSLLVIDYDKDGNPDVVLTGNINRSKLRLGKFDANYGMLLKGDGKGGFKYIPQALSGFDIRGDVRSSIVVNDLLMFGINGSADRHLSRDEVAFFCYLFFFTMFTVKTTTCALLLFISVSAFSQPVIGLQMGSVGKQAKADFPGTLKKLHEWGIKEVEGGPPQGMEAADYLKLLKENDLTLVAIGAGFDQLEKYPQAVADRGKAVGAKQVICYWIPHDGDNFTIDDAKKGVGKAFNKAGEVLQKNGLALGYHAHGYEFRPYENGTLFDYIAANPRSPLCCQFPDGCVLDQSRVAPTLSPVLNKYPNRFISMHLKDRLKGMPDSNNGRADVEKANVVCCGNRRCEY